MSVNNFHIYIPLIKYIFIHHIYTSLIILFFRFYSANNELITSPYPSCLQIDDNILFLSNENGIFFSNLNLIQIFQYQYELNKPIDYEKFLEKLIITKYDEDKYEGEIICIINDVIYAFKKDGSTLLFKGNINEEGSGALYLNLLAYQIDEDDFYHFFMINTYILNSKKTLLIGHYKMKQSCCQIVSYLYYQPFYLDYHGIGINSDYFTCQIMKSQKRGDVLTCCYFAYDNKLIVVQSFDIENEIQEIEEYYSKFPIDNLNIITSVISPDRENMLVCYSPVNKYGYCFTYNFDSNKISNNNPVIEQCDNKYAFFKLNYFPQTEEYVFICKGIEEKFTIVKFDKNFNKINPDEITSENFEIEDYHSFNSVSLIYDKELEKYLIVADSKGLNDSPLLTRRFEVTTDFSKSFESKLGRPQEFEEIYEHYDFIIDETNKYYVYSRDYHIYANSRDHRKIKINFVDENDLILKTKDNKPINTSLYWMSIVKTQEKGKLVINIEGEEKEIGKSDRIVNVSELYYYPEFNITSSLFIFAYSLYLKNNSIASASSLVNIHICKENCSCLESDTFCPGCLEDFEIYKFAGNCISKNDLDGKILISGIYVDCYKMCKTCSEVGAGPPYMKCLTCYTEHGDYQEGENCYEKNCDNLFYFEKDTGMKTCINGTECPKDYPLRKQNTNQCMTETVEETYSIKDSSKAEESSETQKFETNTDTSIGKEISEKSNFIEEDEDSTLNYVKNLIEEEVGSQNLEQINRTYSILSNAIKNGNISSIKKDITISGVNITYQLTNSENQKNANYNSNVSVIDLGECEKIIKRNISYENDPTPLLILKIDIKKVETKSTAVEYEVYNPYTKEKIDLSICSNTTIAIYAPVNLTNQETSLYNNLNEQGYDLFDVNNSFYIDPCSSYTSENGTDVTLRDRKNYYYNEDIVLCEDTCKYVKYYIENNKAYCQCSVKSSVNVDSDQEFSPKALLEKFYKIDTYANFEVLYCYKLVFSSKGLKKNICFYILLILLTSFLTSMIVNLFSAIKKLEQIIFKIFQDRFMYYFMQKIILEGRKRRNVKINNNQQNGDDNKEEDKTKPKLNWIERLKLARKKKEDDSTAIAINKPNNSINLYNPKNIEIKEGIKYKKKKRRNKTKLLKNSIANINKLEEKNNLNKNDALNLNVKINKKKSVTENTKEKDDILNNGNNGENYNQSNIQNNIENKDNPPIKKNKELNETNFEENFQKESSAKNLRRKRKRHKIKKSISQEKGIPNISVSIINLKKLKIKNTVKKTIFSKIKSKKEEKNEKKNEEKNEEKKDENQNAEEVKKPDNNSNIKYIDEELNRMDYENALINDKRNYWQYYWSFLKKKHMIILTFVSNDDYNVFLLKISLFVLSIALFFSVNTLFYRDTTFHQIFSQKGKYSLIYQIPQILYSTLISFFMTLLLKTLSLSQNELIAIKKELDRAKSNQLASKIKQRFKIKLYSFFFIGLFLLIFFWYYISAFGAVYKNTQIHLIKDTLFSYGISMSYPLIINLLPSLLRLIALKSKKKNKQTLYNISQIIGYL